LDEFERFVFFESYKKKGYIPKPGLLSLFELHLARTDLD